MRRGDTRGRLLRLDADLHADADGVPLTETVTLRGALGPFVLDVTRRIVYTRAACDPGR